ncbi:serine/threonine-protein kinase MRCK alpha-like [Homalodisca vitripennis]|uniref:serine/threonine-protein kinase MRCK alpha-like n=1 Tax=Homalodisca vitripennis TaxID=197043 RepID=UPI001EEC4B2E|nr:serine/threonine-protein kinase MRCK alpha-like [Homalodisca vitripennis]
MPVDNMKDLKISSRIFSSILSLLDGYTDANMPALDYLSSNENKILCQEEEYESVVETFLTVVQRRHFLTDVANYFYCLGKRRDRSDQNSLIILIHLTVSVLDSNNKDGMISILQMETLKKALNFLKFFNRRSIEEDLFLAGCQYFEENYVLQNIILNMRENKILLKEMLADFEQKLESTKEETHRKLTIPVSPRLNFNYRSPPPPCNTPLERKLQSPRSVPPSTYFSPKIKNVLKSLQERNREQSLQTLSFANESFSKLSDSVKNVQHHSCSCDKTEPVAPLRRVIKIDLKKDVPIRKNAATILREASRVMKEEEREIQRVNDLMSGAANYMKYEELMEQIRASEQQAQLEELEKKHLQGQLTREEAILARQALLEANKARKAQFDLEKKETEEFLKEMRRNHEEKMKEMIEKTQQIQKNISEKKKNIINEKQKIAQEVTETSRQLYEAAILKHKEELEKRIEIIKEIKALASLKDLQENKFDPTETMNIGLLCEMSLTELYERLQINRASLEEEIKNRQMCIRKQRRKQQQFLIETEQFIESCRQQKKLINNMVAEKQKPNKAKEESPEIIELREKLQNARLKRLELQKNKC